MSATWGAGTGKFGTLTGWALNNTANPSTAERGTAHGPKNDEIASKLYDKRITISETYRPSLQSAAPTIPVLIGLLNSLPLTSIQVSTTQADFASMTLVGHQHTDGTDNGAVKSVAHGMTLDGSFGVSLFGFTADEATESTLTIECEHAEVPDADGDTGAGENHNAKITVSVTAHGGYPSAPGEEWDATEEAPGTDAQGFNTFTTTATKPLALHAT